MVQQRRAIGIFCCYAEEDLSHLNSLKSHLSPFQRQGIIHVWHDGDIRAGTEWDQAIKKYLNEANVILLLISADFIASDYCYGTEMKHALERHRQREAKVIPILLRLVTDWKKVSFGDIRLGQLQALPTDARAVTTWADRDAAWKDVAAGIGRVVNELLKNPYTEPTESVFDESSPVFDESSIEPLVNALLSAFPTQRDLKLLISYKLMKNMEIIAAGNNLEEQVHSLVTWAYSQDQVKALITGALARNPGNRELRQFAMQYGF